MPQQIKNIDEDRYTAAQIEEVVADWYRKTHALPADAEIEVVGIMNRVYVSAEYKEVLPDGRNESGSSKAPQNPN